MIFGRSKKEKKKKRRNKKVRKKRRKNEKKRNTKKTKEKEKRKKEGETGLTQYGVPINVSVTFRSFLGPSIIAETPKSTILTSPVSVRRMLAPEN